MEPRKAVGEATSTHLKGSRELRLEEAGMAGKKTAFEDIKSLTHDVGASATVSGKLQEQTGEPIAGADVVVKLTPPKTGKAAPAMISKTSRTDDSGLFTVPLDTSGLPVGTYEYEAKYSGDTGKELDGTSAKESLIVKAVVPAIPEPAGVSAPAAVLATARATEIYRPTVSPTPIPYGTTSVTVCGAVKTRDGVVKDAEVSVSLNTPCCSPQTASGKTTSDGKFEVCLDTLSLAPGEYEIEVKFAGDSSSRPELKPASHLLKIAVTEASRPGEAPVVPVPTPCIPCSDPIETVNRVIRDRTVSAAVSDLLKGAADSGIKNAFDHPPESVKQALTALSKAFRGTDAVRAKAECCRGQLRLQIYVYDAVSRKHELLKSELLQNLPIQLIDSQHNLAAHTRSDDLRGALFSEVEEAEVLVAFPSEIVKGGEVEVAKYYEVRGPRDTHFTSYTTANEPGNPTVVRVTDTGENTEVDSAALIPEVLEDEWMLALDAITEVAREYKSRNRKRPFHTPSEFRAPIGVGGETIIRCFLNPPPAQVRCFSWLQGDGEGCLQGKQYISCVAISVWQGDRRVICNATGDSGCTGFRLSPGWYTFSAPDCVTIEGCNYALASSSPVSAFLGAGQCCSDIYFRYKKKGNEIQVISKICYPDASNPYVEAFNNLAGMQYLLVSESDPAFVPRQQTTADGAVLSFRDLSAGTYSLYCQAPAKYGAQHVQPVYPEGGRLSLTLFGGQTTAVPVEVRFRTCTTAPAILNGVVWDELGSAMSGQVIKFLNNAGRVIGAALSNAQGVYTFQIYTAEDVTIVFGAQQFAVSKAQIQAEMKTIGTPALPSPDATMQRTVQRSELVAGFGD
jgi:hypothetical protein